jgi:hypothetical protein
MNVIERAIEIAVLGYIFITVVVALFPVAFNSSAVTSFTIWGTSYLSVLGILGVITFFVTFWMFLKGAMKGLGK